MTTAIIGTLVLPDRVLEGTLHVEDGKIVRIVEGAATEGAQEVYDYRGQYVLPGLIEVHGHLREPGLDYKEDIPHGSRAAIAGGFTTIFDMPNTRPPTTTVARVEEQIKRYSGRCYTDFAINMGTSLEDIDELQKIDPKRIAAVKIFAAGHATTPTTIARISDIARVFEILGQRGIMALVHAENQELVDYFTHEYRDVRKRHDAHAWGEARNNCVVLTSVLEMISLAKYYGVKLYLLHQSTGDEFAAIEFGRGLGVDVYGEVTTVHLAFSDTDYEERGHLINISPALRSTDEQETLWHMVREGRIDTIATDHAPHTLEEKQRESVWQVASGLPGFQEALPLLITNWVKHFGQMTLSVGMVRIGQLTARNVAQIFGFEQKGGLEVGKDADAVVVDTQRTWQVRREDLLTKNQWSACEGMELIGRPVATFLRGARVYDDGRIPGEARGMHITRSQYER